MLDLRTLWLTLPEDRYEAKPAWRNAERALYPLLMSLETLGGSPARAPARVGILQG